jgi:hypothetical protein
MTSSRCSHGVDVRKTTNHGDLGLAKSYELKLPLAMRIDCMSAGYEPVVQRSERMNGRRHRHRLLLRRHDLHPLPRRQWVMQ